MPDSPEQLRALSIRQPWADEILRGEKPVEYRSQATTIRGRAYVYSTQAKPPSPEGDDLPRGVIVGTVEIADCEGSDGDFAWLLTNPQRLPEPIAPREQPQPVWFYPFGRPEDAYHGTEDSTADGEVATSSATATRFTPIIAANETSPFTPYQSKYLAYELSKRVAAETVVGWLGLGRKRLQWTSLSIIRRNSSVFLLTRFLCCAGPSKTRFCS